MFEAKVIKNLAKIKENVTENKRNQSNIDKI